MLQACLDVFGSDLPVVCLEGVDGLFHQKHVVGGPQGVDLAKILLQQGVVGFRTCCLWFPANQIRAQTPGLGRIQAGWMTNGPDSTQTSPAAAA